MDSLNPNQPTTIDITHIRAVYRLALEAAKQGFDPFAALLVHEGEVVALSTDASIRYADPTAHAELVVISEYCRANQLIDLEGYTLYCNVEPCVMCSGAIHWARISRVVFGVRQQRLQSVSKGKVKPSCDTLINTGNRIIPIVGPVCEEEGMAVLQAFPFQSKKSRHEQYQKRSST